jgi:hypothetical protein
VPQWRYLNDPNGALVVAKVGEELCRVAGFYYYLCSHLHERQYFAAQLTAGLGETAALASVIVVFDFGAYSY